MTRSPGSPCGTCLACTCSPRTSSTPTTCWPVTTWSSPSRPWRRSWPGPDPRRRPASEPGQQPEGHPAAAGGLGEELRAARRGQVHLRRRPSRQQDPDKARGRGRVRGQGDRGEHPEPAGQAQAHPVRLGAAGGHQAGDRDPRRGRQDRHIRRLSPLRETRPDMAIRKYKPTTPGRRGASGSDFSEITRDEPEKSLVRPLHSRGGRNVYGRITTRHQGGGHKRAYRLIDFRRADKDGVPAKVAHVEYDPNRTARIALLHYADGEKRYIICPQGLSVGDRVESGAG